MNITKKQNPRKKEQTSGYSGGGEENIGMRNERHKLLGVKQATRMYLLCNTGNIVTSNYKWSITFKNCMKCEKELHVRKEWSDFMFCVVC